MEISLTLERAKSPFAVRTPAQFIRPQLATVHTVVYRLAMSFKPSALVITHEDDRWPDGL
jgi:hypothetical protein